LTAIIHTGSTSIDRLLGGGIRTGIVTDIYGQSGAGKSQLCFTLCANYAKHSRQEDRILFIDTVGTFRPERVSEIAGARKNSTVLNKIMFVRALSVYDQIHAISLISDFNPRLVIVDTATALFSDEFRGPTRHLVLMNYIHKLSLTAINFDCAVVITNVIRDAPIRTTLIDQGGHNLRAAIKTTTTDSFQQREFMGASISIYVHIKLKLEIINLEKSLFGASLMQPMQKDRVLFNVTSKGISDE
jgi:RecA/RadA recombinase